MYHVFLVISTNVVRIKTVTDV